MQVTDHLTIDQLRTLANASPGRRRFLRIRAVILAAQGRTAPEVASALGCSRRAAKGWVARSADEGEAGFDERPRTGRPTFLDAEAAERLRARLDAGPTAEDAACTLRGPEVRSILDRKFGILYSLPAVYAPLHRLGDSCLDPRPRHAKADPGEAEEFKKSRRPPRRGRPGPPRQAGRGLVRGRGAVRPEGDADDRLGPTRFAAHRRAPDAVRLPLGDLHAPGRIHRKSGVMSRQGGTWRLEKSSTPPPPSSPSESIHGHRLRLYDGRCTAGHIHLFDRPREAELASVG